MAITVIKNPSTLKMTLSCGTDNSGKEIRKTKSFGNVKATASDDAIYEVANSLASLQEHTLTDIYRVDNSTLAE